MGCNRSNLVGRNGVTVCVFWVNGLDYKFNYWHIALDNLSSRYGFRLN